MNRRSFAKRGVVACAALLGSTSSLAAATEKTNKYKGLTELNESRRSLTSRIGHMLGRPFPHSANVGFVGIVIVLAAAVLLPMARADDAQDGGDPRAVYGAPLELDKRIPMDIEAVGNRSQAALEYDKDIRLNIVAGIGSEPSVVSCDHIRFTKSGRVINATAKIVYRTVADARWRVRLKLVTADGSAAVTADKFLDTKRIIKGTHKVFEEDMQFSLTPPEVSKVFRFDFEITAVDKE